MTYLPLHIPTFLFIEKPFIDLMFKEHPHGRKIQNQMPQDRFNEYVWQRNMGARAEKKNL